MSTLSWECYNFNTCCPASSYLYNSYTYIPDMETYFGASFRHLWQNQAVVTHLKGTWGWQLPNSKTEPLANHVILLADQYACQDVRFTCRHCDRFAKHASLKGNGVTTHRDGMKAARWLVADKRRVCFFGEIQVWFLSCRSKQHTKQHVLAVWKTAGFFSLLYEQA